MAETLILSRHRRPETVGFDLSLANATPEGETNEDDERGDGQGEVELKCPGRCVAPK